MIKTNGEQEWQEGRVAMSNGDEPRLEHTLST